MNKILILFLLLMSHISNAQLYVKAGGGYAFPLPSQIGGSSSQSLHERITDPETGNYVPAFRSHSETEPQIYNTGMSGSISVGYMFTENMGVDLAFSYIKGRKQVFTSLIHDVTDGVETSRSEIINTLQSSANYLSPSLIFISHEGTIRPYVSAGAVLGKIKFESGESIFSNYENFETDLSKRMTHKGGLSLGARGSLGIMIVMNESISLFTECTFNSINFSPKEGKLTQYNVFGKDELNSLSTSQRTIKYVDEINFNSDDDNSNVTNEPGKVGKVTWPMSTIALNAGVTFMLAR